MSRGKYSPVCKDWPDDYEYKFNANGKLPEPWRPKPLYNEKTMYDCYDEDGYDCYGYSAYLKDGTYIGCGRGVDRNGWTEMDYLTLQDIPEEHRDSYHFYNS